MKLGSSLCVNPFLRKGHQGVLQGVLLFSIVFGTGAADWPTYRHDDQRSGVTGEQVDDQLSLRWVFRAPHRPEAAWPLPGEETPRMHTDRAFHTVISGKTLYFGTSVDHKVYALDTESGSIRWTFFCDAAIRFAPVIHGDKLYFGSDDGHAYCLNAADGREIWKFRPGPFAEHVVGRSRMISLWPLRTGLIVNDGIVYFTAGIFPYEGLYIGALNAETGELIWMNDTAGDLAWGLEY
ncbi:MAG TPA: hypothetical protein EYQ50_06650, partial [Verrucomicrobiales bacterium]|nr:hypothetical protein [Verrucomicrobiales bacterium]